VHAFALLAAMLISTPSQELLDAVLAGDEEEARALLEAGADANARNDEGLSALALAAQSGHSEVAAALLELGADVDARTGLDDTPLMMAARHGDPETVEVLIDAGADVHAETLCGGTALSIAATKQPREGDVFATRRWSRSGEGGRTGDRFDEGDSGAKG